MTLVNSGLKGLTHSFIKHKINIIHSSNNPIAVLSGITFYDVQRHDIRTCIDAENQYIMQKRTYIVDADVTSNDNVAPLQFRVLN